MSCRLKPMDLFRVFSKREEIATCIRILSILCFVVRTLRYRLPFSQRFKFQNQKSAHATRLFPTYPVSDTIWKNTIYFSFGD